MLHAGATSLFAAADEELQGVDQLFFKYNTAVPSSASLERRINIRKEVLTKEMGSSVRLKRRDETLAEYEHGTNKLSIYIVDICFPTHTVILNIKRLYICFYAVSCARNIILFGQVSNFLFAHLRLRILTAHTKTEVESFICVVIATDEHQNFS